MITNIHIYLESASHDKQNGGQRFFLQARIAELWQFKAQKVKNNDEEDGPSFFKPLLNQMGLFGCGEEWYHFQQKLMVSETVV